MLPLRRDRSAKRTICGEIATHRQKEHARSVQSHFNHSPGQYPSTYYSTYLLMVIIVGLRTDGDDNGLPRLELVGTRAPLRIAMPVSETTKDVLILCWPCWGPLCAPVAPVDCQLPLWNQFQ